MSLVDDLLAALPEDAPVRAVLVGVHWTVVCSRSCGLASSLLDDKPHGRARVRDVGRLHHKTARELAEYARSDNRLEASLGVAALNSLLKPDEARARAINAGQVLVEQGRGKTVALVGHFPFIPALRAAARQLWVIEQHPAADEHPASAAPDLIPQADIVALTGSALINHTLDSLLALRRADALVMVLGPSTPLSPVLFEHGAAILAGTRVSDEAAALRTIGQGATFQQVEGVRPFTLAQPAGGRG